MSFWDRVFAEVAEEYRDIATESLLVDAACMDLIRRPEDFDVIVASNLFGDILTDMSAMIRSSPRDERQPKSRKEVSLDDRAGARQRTTRGAGVANPWRPSSPARMLDS